MAPSSSDAVRPSDLAEAARLLRAVLAAFPSTTAAERATFRRIEGAAVAVEAAGRHGSWRSSAPSRPRGR